MKKLLAVLLSAVVIISLASCGTLNTSKEETIHQQDSTVNLSEEEAWKKEPAYGTTIHVGYDGGLCQAAVPLAYIKGYFEDEGLNVELTKSGDGTQTAVTAALAGGKLDTTSGMIAGWLKPITNGVDLRIVLGLHTGCSSAFVLADSPVTAFVEGQTIGFAGGVGGIHNNIGLVFAAREGFTQDQLVWKDFGDASALLGVLQNGEADVVVMADQVAEKWVQEGTVRRIYSQHEGKFADDACCVLSIRGDFYDNNPITSKKISRAVYKAAKWIDSSDENKLETANLLLENGHIAGTAEYALSLMKMFKFGLDTDTTEKSIYTTVDEYKRLGIIDPAIDVEAVKAQIWAPIDLEDTESESHIEHNNGHNVEANAANLEAECC
jgi:NitT/TauT family transport system substrate-binding protein